MRRALFLIAAVFMLFAAFISLTRVVPHLREDMVEINVRLTLLRAVMLGLHFGTVSMFTLGLVVLSFGLQPRGQRAPRLPGVIIGTAFLLFGVFVYAVTRSTHGLGYALIGLLTGAAAVAPERPE